MSFEENRIITIRHRRVMAINDIHEATEAGSGTFCQKERNLLLKKW